MYKLTEERKGQIALLFVKDRFRSEGIRLKPDMKRDIGNTAKKIGVSVDELLQLVEELTHELVEEVFPSRSTSHHNPEYTKGM